MIPNDEPMRGQMIQRMLDYLLNAVPKNLSEWESEFLVSINEQFQLNTRLSNKQAEILERIYDNQ